MELQEYFERKIETHIDAVMQDIEQRAGSAGKVVSRFVCMPNKRGEYDDMLDIYFYREAIENKLRTHEFAVSLHHVSVCPHGTLEYWLRLDLFDTTSSTQIGQCMVGKSNGEISIDWEFLCMEEAV